MKLKKGIIVALVFTIGISNTVFSQFTKDIGLRTSIGSSNRISFDYRFLTKDSLRFVIGADFSGQNSFPSSAEVVGASATRVDFMSSNFSSIRPTVRFGYEHVLKKHPRLYLGAHLVVGYQQSNNDIFMHSDSLNENGRWERVPIQPTEINHTYYRQNFITTGATLMAGWDVEISERFLFNLNVSHTFTAAFQVGEAVTNDPFRQNLPQTNLIDSELDFGVGIRYKL